MTAGPAKRVALVTGAARGIGRAIAQRLAEDGGDIWCLDRDAAVLQALPGLVPAAAGASIHPVVADVGDEAAVAAAIGRIKAAHGRLDIVVNNAGIADPFNGPIESLALEDWERRIRTNLTGYFLCAKHAVALLRPQQGVIVNIASTRALQSEPNTEAYAASKGGIQALTHALAVSLGPDIRVNAVAPGWIDVRGEQGDPAADPAGLRAIDHAQHPGGRAGCGQDIAGVVAFLCGPDAGFITGQMLVADGGMTCKMIYNKH